MRTFICLLCAWWLLIPAVKANEPLTLIYSGNLDGELEPCGCTLDTDFGGILRRASIVDGVREQHQDLVLISSGGLFSQEMVGDRIKNRAILSGLAQLNYDAIGVQWPDLSLGVEFLSEAGLPLTASNWSGNEIARSRTIQRGQQTLLYTQWLDPQSSPYRTMPTLSPIDADTEALQAQLSEADQAGQLTILATTLSAEQAREQFKLEAVDLLIIGSGYEQIAEPYMLDGTLVLQPGSRGQRLGQLQLQINEQGELSGWQHQIIELSNQVPDATRLQGWYADYNEDLRQAYEAEVKQLQAQESGESPYLGEQVCLACHQQQHQVWQNSQHAKAFEDLEQVGKAYDPHCVGCHTVGFKQPGGFLSIELSSSLAGVQCENCHGQGREHVQSGGQQQTPNHGLPKEAVCGQCHVPQHSPRFSVDGYWPKILHSASPMPKAP